MAMELERGIQLLTQVLVADGPGGVPPLPAPAHPPDVEEEPRGQKHVWDLVLTCIYMWVYAINAYAYIRVFFSCVRGILTCCVHA